MSIAYYDEHGEAFFRDSVSTGVAHLHARFLDHMTPGGRVLDAGCGSGRDALAFRLAGFEVEAFDGSARMVDLARTHTGLPVRHMRFDEVEWTDEFDGIWACASLLHVARAELPATMARLVRALKPGGVMFASFKEGDQEREQGGRRFTDLTETALSSLLTGLGMEVLDLLSNADGRPGREGERWVSAVGRKRSISP
jgi:2-polyprenyl-3-methyl-5-hydroxy-6-metoxy-1,4-benzoquinol methylase